MKRKLLSTDPRVIKAIEMYQSGIGFKVILKELHMDGASLNKFLEELGIKRSHNESVRRGKGVLSVNDNAFDILIPDTLYWIGFLYADGHIEKDRPRVSFTVSGKDKSHLEKFNQFMGGHLNIFEVTEKNRGNNPAPGQINFDYQYFRISCSSKKAYTRLKELGFTHNKTLSLNPHESLKHSRDFFRGTVDGDGWVGFTGDKRAGGKYNYPMVGLSGTEDTVTEFINFVNLSGIDTKTTPRKDSRNNVWQVDIHGTKAVAIVNLLYKDSTIYLDRKYQKYLEIVNSPQPIN